MVSMFVFVCIDCHYRILNYLSTGHHWNSIHMVQYDRTHGKFDHYHKSNQFDIGRQKYIYFHQYYRFQEHIRLKVINMMSWKLHFDFSYFYLCKSYQIHKLVHLYIDYYHGIYLHQYHMQQHNMVRSRYHKIHRYIHLHIHHYLNIDPHLYHMEK